MEDEPTKNEMIVRTEQQILAPVATTQELVRAMKEYQALKVALLQHDVDTYTREGVERIRKSGWRKLALAFGVSDELIHEWKDTNPDGPFTWHMRVRVRTPSGRTAEGVGSATSHERAPKLVLTEHGTRALAHTRAKSRAIADLLGSGDMVAEEDIEEEPQHAAPSPPKASEPDVEKVRKYLMDAIGPLSQSLDVVIDNGMVCIESPVHLAEAEFKRLTRQLWQLGFTVEEDRGICRARRKLAF